MDKSQPLKNLPQAPKLPPLPSIPKQDVAKGENPSPKTQGTGLTEVSNKPIEKREVDAQKKETRVTLLDTKNLSSAYNYQFEEIKKIEDKLLVKLNQVSPKEKAKYQ